MPAGETWGCFQRTAVSGLKCVLHFPSDEFRHVSAEARSLVTRCMQCAPERRVTASQLFAEKWCVEGLAVPPPPSTRTQAQQAETDTITGRPGSAGGGFGGYRHQSPSRPDTVGGGEGAGWGRMVTPPPPQPGFVLMHGFGFEGVVANPYRMGRVSGGDERGGGGGVSGSGVGSGDVGVGVGGGGAGEHSPLWPGPHGVGYHRATTAMNFITGGGGGDFMGGFQGVCGRAGTAFRKSFPLGRELARFGARVGTRATG